MKLEICLTIKNKKYRWCEKLENLGKLRSAFRKALKSLEALLGR